MRFGKITTGVLALLIMVLLTAACAPTSGSGNSTDDTAAPPQTDGNDNDTVAAAEVSDSVHSELRDLYLAGGCFWGMEGYYRRVRGVVDTEVGYANGNRDTADYEHLDESGHAETLKITYDIHQIHTAELIDRFFRIIDPFSVNRQGNDIGTQYRSGIYFTEPETEAVANEFVTIVAAEHPDREIAVEVLPLEHFIPAEDYHQDYLDKNPGGYCHINLAEAEDILYPGKPAPDDAELKEKLSEAAYNVTRENGTEFPGSSEYLDFSTPGIYVDIISGQPVFSTDDQYESGCGWPSFTMPITTDAMRYRFDDSLNMRRTEVRSDDADAHLGHVFTDGPADRGGMRYCINGAALRFIPLDKLAEEGYGRLAPYVRKR